jgi:hypothetical protein
MVGMVLSELALLLVRLEGETPKPEDVKAGWTAFAIFLLLLAAVVALGFSLSKQLRKAQAAKEAGVYGDAPAVGDAEAEPEKHSAS